jgi:hypothetical protein
MGECQAILETSLVTEKGKTKAIPCFKALLDSELDLCEKFWKTCPDRELMIKALKG